MTETSTSSPDQAVARILLPLPLPEAYDYLVQPALAVRPGDYVRVPLGRRTLVGVVWTADQEPRAAVNPARLKPIEARHDVSPMTVETRRLVDWVASYTMTPPGAVLRMAMGPSATFDEESERVAYALPASRPAEYARLTPARERVLSVLADGVPLGAATLAREAGCSPAVVRGMAQAGLIEPVRIPQRPPRPIPDWRRPFMALAPAQATAAEMIRDAVRGQRFETFLLDGVTGSGKTEVYFRAIAAALEAGRQTLILLPEIVLGTQWHARFEQQFGCRAAAWHSDIKSSERAHVWRDVAEGRALVVVGARSALFLPFANLGLIVVDEEHDASFKQEDGVIYQARDMAVVRASLHDAPIVLASATPSLETLANVERGRYRRLILPDRHGGALLPDIDLIDLRASRPARQGFLSPTLLAQIEATLEAGEQTMVFLNRRGYAPLTLCRTCGHRINCPNCSAWLVEHRLLGRLMCHHCGHVERPPARCPECDDQQSLAACGPGVERVAEELTRHFPAARMAVVASDTLGGPSGFADIVRQVEARTLDILVGTQIMAKGHHFPMLTLVGVVDADLGLAGGDLRAAERTYQMLHQVAGRAGRAERPGRVLLQTFDPDHPVMQALRSGARDRFLKAESEARERHGLPPHGRLVAVIISAPDDSSADEVAAAVARAAPHVRGVNILGPAPAPLAILRARHRRRFLLKAERQVNVQAVVRQWLGGVRIPTSVRVQVDIDPYSFL